MEAGKDSLTRDTVRDATREVRAHERPREVGGPDSGGRDPVKKTEAVRPATGAQQEHLLPVAGS